VIVKAAEVYIKGTIRGKDGADGNCGQDASSGSSINLEGTDVVNIAPTAKIIAGNGGNAPAGAGHPCPARRCGERQNTTGGAGGYVKIRVGSQIFNTDGALKNYGGFIKAGNGGNAGAAHATAIGGKGGYIKLNDVINKNNSFSAGVSEGGSGGLVCAPVQWWQNRYPPASRPGTGGDIKILISRLGGEIKGKPGSMLHYDPINLKADEDLRIKDFDVVEIYTDEGGTIDFTQLQEGAISARKTIRISTKALNGKGGTVNLKGVPKNVFNAGEKVEIFADDLQLDEGVTLEDLADAPDVVVAEGRILYSVALAAQSQFFGEGGAVVTIPVTVMNQGPKEDTYSFKVSDTADWVLGALPTTKVDGLKEKKLELTVTLPATPGAKDVINITATSQTVPAIEATLTVYVTVNPGGDTDGDGYPDSRDAFPKDPTEWRDSDKDGVGNNADTDDDNDGMPDAWEDRYKGLSSASDDAAEDADGDGASNLDEYKAGTNPDDKESVPPPVVEPPVVEPPVVEPPVVEPPPVEGPVEVRVNCKPKKEGTDCTVDLSSLVRKANTVIELVVKLPKGVGLNSVQTDYGKYDDTAVYRLKRFLHGILGDSDQKLKIRLEFYESK
jgi:hypothetical protein